MSRAIEKRGANSSQHGSKGFKREILTLGHSTRSLTELLRILKELNVKAVVDVRRFPTSKKFPHFNRMALEKALNENSIEYAWFEALGGFRGRKRRPGKCLKAGGFQAYKEHLDSPQAKQALGTLQRIALQKNTAILCSERLFWKCHRSVLGSELEKKGWRVKHVI